MTEALATPDMIVAGGTLLTSDPNRPYIQEGWVVINNGRKQSIQDKKLDRFHPATKVIDAKGFVITQTPSHQLL